MLSQNTTGHIPSKAPLGQLTPGVMWHRRADRRVMQRVWLAWHGEVVHHAHVKQVVANAVLRICHRSSAAAFEHWQQYVAAAKSLHLEQQHAKQRMQNKQLQKICLYWRALAALKQQYKVSGVQVAIRQAFSASP